MYFVQSGMNRASATAVVAALLLVLGCEKDTDIVVIGGPTATDPNGTDAVGSDGVDQGSDGVPIPPDTGDTAPSSDTETFVDSAPADTATGDTAPGAAESDPESDDRDSDTRDLSQDSETGVRGTCGDGILTQDEACDDANTDDGDGCAADCRSVEVGYSCNPAGEPCRKVARCGDGVPAFPELCDDGNQVSGDGCSESCKVEIGYKCEGTPSACVPTTCGDGIREGAESCDDGNGMPFDGCGADCRTEPNCTGGRCVSECGDGLVIDEECDDGNTLDGDGCSSACTVEVGYTCAAETECEQVAGVCVQRISAVYRDFGTYSDPAGDFSGGGDMILGLLETRLDRDGKPVALTDVAALSNGSIASPDSFARWYRDTEDSETKVGSLVLFDNDRGGYVNRWRPDGTRWCVDDTCYDGTPTFFPVDDLSDGSDFHEATIPEEYGGGWLPESTWVPDAAPHNYGFTTEVMYWFEYDPAEPASLEFLGDDDMWVFVNGVLALDMGNVHMPELGQVTIDPDTAPLYDLEPGGVYTIQVFHAERNPTGSSFKLTLSGFNPSRSLCLPTCGDGIVSLGEECDDGVNDGGYGECYEGCVLGDFCGDGIVQENEDCDDGNTLDGDGCGSSCRHLIII